MLSHNTDIRCIIRVENNESNDLMAVDLGLENLVYNHTIFLKWLNVSFIKPFLNVFFIVFKN